MIFCEFNYCIYYKKSRCMLKNISISSFGMCEACMIPHIDEEILEKYKIECMERWRKEELEKRKYQKSLN